MHFSPILKTKSCKYTYITKSDEVENEKIQKIYKCANITKNNEEQNS